MILLSNAKDSIENNNFSSWILKQEIKDKRLPFIFIDETGTEIYKGVRRKFDLINRVFVNTNWGENVATIRRKYWAIKVTYALLIGDKRIALLKRTFDLTRISFTINELGLRLIGETDERQVKKAGYGRKRSQILETRYSEYKFRLLDSDDNVIMEFYPDLETDENCFFIKVYDKEKELICLCLVLAVYLEIDEMNRPD